MNRSFQILAVEDEQSDYDLLELSFARAKTECQLRWARDGQDAVEQLSTIIGAGSSVTEIPDLIITDLNLPRLSGHQLLGWLKSHPLLRTIPVLVMSSSDRPADVQRAYEHGASAYFFKPGDLDSLVRVSGLISQYWKLAMLPHLCSTTSGGSSVV